MSRGPRRPVRALLVLVVLALAFGCAVPTPPPAYAPQERHFVVTAVPLLTKEMVGIYPFLQEDFAQDGVLEGKEVYAFVPSTLVAVAGDTLHFTFVNPEDDEHDFVLPGLAVVLPGKSITRADWHAERAGIFTFSCTIAAHAPEMYGQLLVLPASVGAGFSQPTSPDSP